VADFPVRLSFSDKLQDFGRAAVCFDSLPGSPTEYDATLASRRYSRTDPLAQ
jgi:hypothetical protein